MREPSLYRPLLPFWKEELEAYAADRRLRWCPDPSNTESIVPRNVIRNDILPLAEAKVAPSARRALHRLGTLAAEEERLWRTLVPTLLGGLDVEREDGAISFARDPFLVYDPIVQTRLLRTLAKERGAALDAAGTRAALEFTRAGASGGALSLPGGVILSRSFGRVVIARDTGRRESRSVTVDAPGDGAASGLLEGRPFTARWSTGGPVGGEGFSVSALRFPIIFRGWRPGDRIRLSYGAKKLKKLFGEARVPRESRGRMPIVVDAADHVLWVPGLTRSIDAVPGTGDPVLFIGVDLNVDDV